MLLLIPAFSHAQTNVGDTITETVGGVIKDKFKSETGLDKLEEIKGDIDAVKDLDAGALADKTVDYVRGEVPSQVMSNLVTQITVGPDIKTPTPFSNLFLKKDPYGNRTKVIPACHLAANEKMRAGLFELRVRGHFSPWIDIAWEAVKSIASGGSTLSELIAEHTKSKVEEMLKEALFGEETEPKVEVYTYEHRDSCNTTTKVTWDPVNYRLIAVTNGACKCELHETDCGPAKLKEFQVILIAPVVTSVRIKTEERLFGWISPKHTVQANYRVDLDKMKVSTFANCGQCEKDESGSSQEVGFWTGLVNWIKDIFVSEPEDKTDPPEEETGEIGETEDGAGEDTSGGENTTGGGFLGGLFGGRDDAQEPEDQITEETGNSDEEGETEVPLQCGTKVSVDGRSGVATFPYRPDANGDVNFSCNNSCKPHQVCKVLPESVGAFRDSCVYCADKPETTVIEEKQDTPVSTGGNCEAAVRLLLDEYGGWFDPPVTFSANKAEMFHEHRCFDEGEFDEFTRQPFNEGAADPKIKAMCPSLKHEQSFMTRITAGAKGLCSSTTIFSF